MMVFGLSVGFAQNKTGESEARPENVEPSTPGGPVTPASPVKPVVSNKKRPTLRGGTMNLPAGASLPAGGAVKKPAGANLPGNNSAMGRPDNRSVENEQPLLPNVGNGSPTGMPGRKAREISLMRCPTTVRQTTGVLDVCHEFSKRQGMYPPK